MIRSIILGGFLLFFAEMNAQVMWPGDINNNGVTNHLDLLYLGNAMGTVGPPRTDTGIAWEAKDIPTLWAEEFPNGVNYAYADCDGNGIIDYDDYQALEINYGETHGVLVPDNFDIGIQGQVPPLNFEASFDPIVEGTFGQVLLTLGTDTQPIEDFYGIAFTINFDPNILAFDMAPFPFFGLFEEEWFNFNNNPPIEIARTNFAEGKIEVAVSNVEGVPAPTNFGELGALFIVIIDNVVGLGADQILTPMYIDDIKLFDESGMSQTAIYGDSIDLVIYNDDFVNNEEAPLAQEIQVYPNPINEQLTIQAKNALIEQVELFDLTGRQLVFMSDLTTQKITMPAVDLPKGIYQLQMQTSKGRLSKKVVVQH